MDLATLDTVATDASYARLRELIVDAELLPNTHHMMDDIADRLSLTAGRVHEAAQRLQVEGLVMVEPRRGFWILPLTSAEVLHTFRQIGALEARAAYLAALHGATSIDMAALDDAVVKMEDALFRDARPKWAAASHHFHRSLLQCSGHTGLISEALVLSEALHRTRMITLAIGPAPIEATQDAATLLHAVRGGSAIDARDICLKRWQSAARTLVDLLRDNCLDRISA